MLLCNYSSLLKKKQKNPKIKHIQIYLYQFAESDKYLNNSLWQALKCT